MGCESVVLSPLPLWLANFLCKTQVDGFTIAAESTPITPVARSHIGFPEKNFFKIHFLNCALSFKAKRYFWIPLLSYFAEFSAIWQQCLLPPPPSHLVSGSDHDCTQSPSEKPTNTLGKNPRKKHHQKVTHFVILILEEW